MAKAKKLPSGSWRVQVYDYTDADGRRHYESFTSDDKAEAEYQAAEFSRDKKRKRIPRNLTLSEAIDEYIRIKDSVLSPTTISGYKKIKRNNLQVIMSVPLKKITPELVQQVINDEAKKTSRRGKPMSPKSIANIHGLLASVLGMFCPDLHLSTKLPAKIKKFKELLPPEIIFDVVRGTEIELPVLLAMWLSFSMSEIRGIKKSSIANGYIRIQGVIVDVDNKPTPKEATKAFARTRQLQIPAYINTLIEAAMSKTEGEYLIPMSGQAIYKRFSRLLEKANLPHMTFHELRHVNASVMLQLGVPDKYAMERGGWSSTKTMKTIYQHTYSTEREEVDRRINEYFERQMQHEMQHKK